MNKNLLLSLVAMSAPMVAFADADFPLNTNKGSDKWVSDGGTQKEITEDNVISSPGAHVTTQVTLCPGKYSFSVGEGSDNARLVLAHKQNWSSTDDGVITDKSKIDGIKATVADAASKTYTYEVTKEMTVWLRVCCITDNKAFTAKGVKMTLVYDFEAEALKLDNEAVFNLSKVDKTKYPEVAEKLENEATRIKGLILEMKQQQNAEGAYDYYKKHQLWNGVESLQVWKDIQKLKKDIDYAANVTAVYAYAKEKHDAISEMLTAVNFKKNAYAEAKYKKDLTALSNSFKTDFAGIEEYQTDAEYTTKFSKEKVDALVTKYKKKTTALQNNINGAIANDEAYNAIVPQVDAVKAAYLAKQKELTGLMNANEGQEEENVYEGLLQKATVELADANRMVTDTDFAEKLGNKESHDNAAENQKNLEETVAAAQAKINATVEDYTNWYNAEVAAYANQKEVIAGKRGQLKLTYEPNADIDALKTAASDAIDAFEAEIKKQNSAEGNWDLHNYVNSEAYNAQLATIDSKIKAFAKEVGVDAANFNNFNTLQKTITDLNTKLAEAKTAVAKMTYDKDGYKYIAVAQNNTLAIDGTEKGKEGSLTKAKAYVGKEYDAKTTYDLSKVDQAAIAGQIASYQSIAQASFDAYKVIVGNLAADKKAAAELKTLVGDEGYITNAAGKTYDAVVADVEKKITDAAKPLAEALKKQNAEHQKALEDIYTSQKDDIAAHKTQFVTDKAEYIKNTNIKDATQLRDAAQDVVKGINGTVTELEKKIKGAGTKKDAFTKELDNVKQEVAKHQGVLDSYKVIDEKNSLEAAAELGKVQKATAELQNQLAELEKKVDAQLAVVMAEQNFLKGLRANDGDLGKLKATIAKIKATNKDVSRNTEFDGLYNEVNALYVALDKEAADSCEVEKLQARWIEYYQDQKDDKGKAIRGLKGSCMDIQATADKHVKAAEASTANWKAYNDVNKRIDELKFDESIADARGQITNGVVVPGQKDKQEITGEAQTFYLAEIVKFENSLKELKEQIETSYADPKREMAAKKTAYEKSLNDLSANIKNLPGKAAANEKANNELKKKSEGIEKKLNEVITYVSENDKTSMRDVYLQQLTAQQKALINEDKAVASEWAKGLLGENEQKHDAAYNAINEEILNIEAKQKGDYSEVVNAENQAYFDKFQAEYTKALNVHKQAVAKIETYFNLKHEVLRDAVRENAKAHEVEIYNEMQKAKDLKAKFETEYSKKDPTLVFEFPEETSFKTLQGHLTKIQGFTDALQADAEKDAKNYLQGQITSAQNLLAGQRYRLDKLGFETSATAHADVEAQIQAATDFKVTEAQDYVIELDGTQHINNLVNTPSTISKGEFAAAGAEWDHFLATTDKKDVTKKDNMDTWTQAVGYYKENGVLVPGSFQYPKDKAAKHETDRQNMTEAYNYFSYYFEYGNPGLDFIVEYKGYVTEAYEGAKGIYDEASELVADRVMSDAAYKELINGSKDFTNNHTALMEQLAHLNEYAAVYAISMETPWSYQIDALTGNLYDALDELDAAKKSATVQNVLDKYKKEFNAYAQQLDKTQKELASKYTIADTYQEEALAEDLENLKKEINKAVANSSYTIEHFDALRERLAQYTTDFEAAKKLAGYQAKTDKVAEAWPKHDAFAALQVKIAADLQEVRGSYTENNDFAQINANFEKRIAKLTELSNKLSGLVASDATHQQVKDKYRSQSESIKAELEEVKAYVDAHRDANGKILYYYNANVEKLIADAEAKNNTDVIYAQRVIDNLNRDERAYDNHETRYAAVRQDLVNANEHFNNVTWYEISNYQHKNPYYELQKAQIAEKVAEELEWLDANKTGNEAWIFNYRGLNNGIRTAMVNLQKAAAMAETDYLYNQEGMDLLESLYYALFDSQFTEADCKEYEALYDSLTTAYGNMSTYNDQLETNYVNVDIDGNKHVDHWGDDVYEPYMQFGEDKHNYQAVHAKAKELNQKVNDLLEVIAANRINPGDLNNDGAIDATDYVIVLNYVKGKPFSEDARQAEREFMRADVNGDGNKQINIGDLVKINNLVRGVDNRVMLLAQPLSLHARQVDNITLAAEGEGVNKRIAISLNNSVSYVGCQMDILLPEGVTLVSESVADRASNHEIYSSELENGAHRVIVASQNNDEFMGAEGAVIYLDVQVGHSYKGEGIQVSNVMFADPGSQVYHLNSLMGDEVTGIGTVTMTEELKSKVYNVGGQLLNGLKKGVNIIKMQDGTVKKIFKK